jgi:hypothetical protein
VLALLDGFLLLEKKKERRRKKFASLFILLLKDFFFFFSTRYGDISSQETVEKTNSQVCWVPDLEKNSEITRCEEESRSDNKPTKQ